MAPLTRHQVDRFSTGALPIMAILEPPHPDIDLTEPIVQVDATALPPGTLVTLAGAARRGAGLPTILRWSFWTGQQEWRARLDCHYTEPVPVTLSLVFRWPDHLPILRSILEHEGTLLITGTTPAESLAITRDDPTLLAALQTQCIRDAEYAARQPLPIPDRLRVLLAARRFLTFNAVGALVQQRWRIAAKGRDCLPLGPTPDRAEGGIYRISATLARILHTTLAHPDVAATGFAHQMYLVRTDWLAEHPHLPRLGVAPLPGAARGSRRSP